MLSADVSDIHRQTDRQTGRKTDRQKQSNIIIQHTCTVKCEILAACIVQVFRICTGAKGSILRFEDGINFGFGLFVQ